MEDFVELCHNVSDLYFTFLCVFCGSKEVQMIFFSKTAVQDVPCVWFWKCKLNELASLSQKCCLCCDTVFHFVTHLLHRPDMHFLDAICWFPMVYYMVGSIDKQVTMSTAHEQCSALWSVKCCVLVLHDECTLSC